eukprot:TRINITY_DN757_c0_g1_i1.p1 TRINITY_DN757_c0_g1~~TRINITY_DN757_c0_g1_i1.p1  ORF type:complete len:365 (+),score=85.24 TRINITY_DN757_c0_g1_i1:73-1167(+)
MTATQYAVELTASSSIWAMAAQMATLRALVQELTNASSLPPLIVQQGDAQGSLVAVKACSHGTRETICSADTVEAAMAQVSKMLKSNSMITFTTDNDRPGLLSEVTDLLRAHGVNVKTAEISTDSSSGRAMHMYDIEDAATGDCVPTERLAKLEAAFASLQDDLKKISSISTVQHAQGHPSELAACTGGKSYLVRAMCPTGSGHCWNLATELSALRQNIKDLTQSAELPAVDVQMISSSEPRLDVVSFRADAPQDQQVVCSGSTVSMVQSEFSKVIGGSATVVGSHSKVTFRTDKDHPGLLADVTEVLKLNKVNVMRARVSTDKAARSALHEYEVADATTGQGLSDSMIAQLESDFRKLRDASQ